MKINLLILLIWLNAAGGSLWASDLTTWSQGELSLQNGTEFTGELSFNWKAQVVQCRQGAQIKAYSATQIHRFAYIDQWSALRRFVAIDRWSTSGHWRPRLLEEVVVGTLMVYRDLRPTHALIKAGPRSETGADLEKPQAVNDFTYLVFSGRELLPMDEFFRRLWPQIKATHDSELDQYAKRIHAIMPTTVFRLRMICMYNSLLEKVFHQAVSNPDLGLTGQ